MRLASPKLVKTTPCYALLHQLPLTLGKSFYIKDNWKFIFKLWCLIL